MSSSSSFKAVTAGAGVALPLVQTDSKCGLELLPGEVKRCGVRAGTLIGYTIACPACGAIGTHLAEEAGFVEVDGKLVRSKSMRCRSCKRTMSIAGSSIFAFWEDGKTGPNG